MTAININEVGLGGRLRRQALARCVYVANEQCVVVSFVEFQRFYRVITIFTNYRTIEVAVNCVKWRDRRHVCGACRCLMQQGEFA